MKLNPPANRLELNSCKILFTSAFLTLTQHPVNLHISKYMAFHFNLLFMHKGYYGELS